MVDVMPIANKTANKLNAVKNHFPTRLTLTFPPSIAANNTMPSKSGVAVFNDANELHRMFTSPGGITRSHHHPDHGNDEHEVCPRNFFP